MKPTLPLFNRESQEFAGPVPGRNCCVNGKVMHRAGFVFLAVCLAVEASNLANPAINLPPARLSVGASYHAGGYTITNLEIPAIYNRLHLRCTYSPLQLINFGIDAGIGQIEVGSYTGRQDTFSVFHGKVGFSGGIHLKLSTPFFLNNTLAVVGIGQATYLSSTDADKVSYGGFDGAGGAGLQVRIPGFGYLTGGAHLYLIQGKNKGYNGSEGEFSNINNLRGWVAVDFMPSLKGDVKGKPYATLEATVAPGADLGSSVPIRELGISFSVGWILPRLYGEEFEETE